VINLNGTRKDGKEMRRRKFMVKKGEDDHATWRVGNSKISEKSRHLKCSHTQDKTQNI